MGKDFIQANGVRCIQENSLRSFLITILNGSEFMIRRASSFLVGVIIIIFIPIVTSSFAEQPDKGFLRNLTSKQVAYDF